MNESTSNSPQQLLLQNKYEIIKLLGKGSYSHVYEGKHIFKNNKVAIKFDIKDNEISRKLLQNEINAYLHLLKHKLANIANIKSFGIISNRSYIIMDCLYMDLESYFTKEIDNIDVQTVNELMNNVFILINNMHKTGLVHRDIKPENFLFNKENRLCIIDLGLSTSVHDIRPSHKIIGTPLFCSYNIHKTTYTYSTQDDIISIYFMFLYLISKDLPWDRVSIHDEFIKNTTQYNLKKYSDFHHYYQQHVNNELLIPVIKSYQNYMDNNEIRFYN